MLRVCVCMEIRLVFVVPLVGTSSGANIPQGIPVFQCEKMRIKPKIPAAKHALRRLVRNHSRSSGANLKRRTARKKKSAAGRTKSTKTLALFLRYLAEERKLSSQHRAVDDVAVHLNIWQKNARKSRSCVRTGASLLACADWLDRGTTTHVTLGEE